MLVPGVWRGFDFTAMARALSADPAGAADVLDVLDASARGRPGDPAAAPPQRRRRAVRWIYYTSGTTAEPKGVRHTDRHADHRRPRASRSRST